MIKDELNRADVHADNIGVVGDYTSIEGGIHFHRETIIYDGVKPVSAGHLLDACQAQVASVLFDARFKYDANLYVNRAVEQELNAFFDTPLDGPAPNCFLIVAPAGSGKTNLLCDLARVRVAQQPVVMLLGGNTSLSGTTGLLGAVKDELEIASSAIAFRNAGDSLHTLDRLAEETGRNALLFLDAINEHNRPVAMRQALEDLFRRTRGRRVKLVVTCRDYYWGLFKGQFWKGVTVNELPDENEEIDGESENDFSRFALDEHERALTLYLDHYNIIGGLVGEAVEQCRHPLLLRFFCEAYRNEDIDEVEDIRLKELFDHYWSQKLASIAERMLEPGSERLLNGLMEEVGSYLLNIAAYMLQNNVRAIPLDEMVQATQRTEQYDDPRSVYGRIQDEFIILEEKEHGTGQSKEIQVAFVYEEFMEYVMARALIYKWDQAGLDESAILNEIEALTGKYESFAQILGVMVYLALMLKKQRNLALWPLLLSQGQKWQQVVFEAFRKLPEDQIDSNVLDTLEQMLRMDDENLHEKALDLLKLRRVGTAASKSISLANRICSLANSSQNSVARRAALVLGYAPFDVAVPVLIEVLHHSSSKVRDNAVTALTRQGQSATPFLVTALKDRDSIVRRRAAQALGQLRDARAAEPLIAALKDRDSNVRQGAAQALKQLNWKPLGRELTAWYLMIRRNWQQCVQLGDAAVEPLITALKDSDWRVRQGAAQALGQLGDARAVEPLITALKDSNSDVRQEVTNTLKQLGNATVEPLIAALKDRDWSVRHRTAQALGQLEDVRAVEPLITALKDSDWRVRQGAAQALGQLGDAPAVEPLVITLKDSDWRVRQGAAQALGQLGDARAVEPLIAALKDRDSNVRQGAAQALGQLGDARAVEPLITALKDSDWRVRQGAAQALGQLRDVRAVEPLIAALKDRDSNVRQGAAQAMGQLGDVRAVEPLIAALKDRDWSMRHRAAQALGQLGDARAVEILVTALQDRNSDVRQGAAQALGQLGDARAVEPLVTALKDRNWSVWHRAAQALRQLGDARAVETLVTALKDDSSSARHRAAQALGQLGDARAVEPLITALKDNEKKDIRQRAAEALRQIGTPEALAALCEYEGKSD